MTEHHTLSDRLRARAQQLGLSPAHVAEMAGVNRSFVYDILRGRSARPGIDKLAEVARVLKVEREWLIHGIAQTLKPLWIGSVVLGLAVATIVYTILNLAWRIYLTYRFHTRRARRQRSTS